MIIITRIIRIISKTKGWHNILTNSSTFVETSATAMFFVGLSQGLQNGWLEEVILIFKADDDNDHDEVADDNDHDEVADDDDHNQQWTKPRIAEWVA